MKSEIIVQCGGLGLRLIGSPLYLEDEALTGRIKLAKGSSFAKSAGGEPAQSFPEIRFFSLPNHLLERLWLEEIPMLTGVAEPSPEPPRNGRQWRGLDTLSILLETIEQGFSKPVEVIFQSSVQAVEQSADSQHDICDRAANAAPAAAKADSWRFGAWLNLDNTSHFARVDIRESENNNGGTQEAITLEIGPREGILWQRAQLHMTEIGPGAKETSNKLVLLGGKTPLS